MARINFILSMIVLALTGCAYSPEALNAKKTVIAPGISMNFPALTDLNASVEATQMIIANYAGQSYSFQNQLSVTPEKLLIVFYDPMGRSGLTISWSKDKIIYQKSAFMPDNVAPENVLADFILTNWPIASIEKSLAGSGAVVTDVKNIRRISVGDQTLIEIKYSSKDKFRGKVVYQNLPWKYKLDIQSVRQAP